MTDVLRGAGDLFLNRPIHGGGVWGPRSAHQGTLQVEGLRVLTQQHHVLLQVVEAAVLVVADALLGAGEAALSRAPWHPGSQPPKAGSQWNSLAVWTWGPSRGWWGRLPHPQAPSGQ